MGQNMSQESEPRSVGKTKIEKIIRGALITTIGVAAGAPVVDAITAHAQDPVKDKKVESFQPKGMPSEQAYKERVTATPTVTATPEAKNADPSKKEALVIQLSWDTIQFIDNLGRQRVWKIDNSTWGISPNPGNVIVGTSRDSINGIQTNNVQFNTSLYPEIVQGNSGAIAAAGQTVDESTKKFFRVAGVLNPDDTFTIHVESGNNFNDPNNYSERQRVSETGEWIDQTLEGNAIPVGIVIEDGVKYLELTINSTLKPDQNGRRRIQLDNLGNAVGDWIWIKVTTATSTATATATPTVSPTPKSFRNFLVVVMNKFNTIIRGGW